MHEDPRRMTDLRPVLQSDLDGLIHRQHIRGIRLTHSLHGHQLGHNGSGIALRRHQFFYLILSLDFGICGRHILNTPVRHFRFCLNEVDGGERADLDLNLIVGKRFLSEVD